MKNPKVKKSPAVLGLSKKSKDKLKSRKKSKVPLSSTFMNVVKNQITNKDVISKSESVQKKDNHSNSNQKSKVVKKTNSKVQYINSNKVLPAVKAFFDHYKNKNKKSLFDSEGTPIFAQFETVAIPTHPKTTLRINLTHSPENKICDVVLIITDEKKHHRKLRHDDEMYIINFTDKLKELGVTQISKVMTLRQIRAEYYTHEMRRKLSDMYDVFLVDGKIAAKLSSIIGKKFYESRKVPIPISLEKDNKIQLEVERALKKTQIVFKSTCCTNSVCKIGHTDMSVEQICDNLEALSKGFDKCKYPGGWKNIRKVFIKTATSTGFPVYYSFVTPNEIENAELKQTLPKKCVAVKGELSTIGRDVTVRPDGSIEVDGVDDIKSLMHQLYRHAGFKDHKELDLSDAEYKELMKEIHKRIPTRKEIEEREAAKAGEMIVDELVGDSDEDDNEIEGEFQREDKLKEDFEDDGQEGDDVEDSYMKQWEEAWIQQKSEDEDETDDKGTQKKNKNAAKKKKSNKKRKQEDDGGTYSKQASKNSKAIKSDKKKDLQGQKNADKNGKKNKISAKDTPDKKIDLLSKKNADKSLKKNKNSAKDTPDKKIDLLSKKNADKNPKKNKKSAKDTPLRSSKGVKLAKAVEVKKKKQKKQRGDKTANFIPL